MSILARLDALPLNAQVSIRDPLAIGYPQWQSGEELSVSDDSCVAVATQDDVMGLVLILILDEAGDITDATMVYSGRVILEGECLAVGSYEGSYEGGHEVLVPLGPGPVSLDILRRFGLPNDA